MSLLSENESIVFVPAEPLMQSASERRVTSIDTLKVVAIFAGYLPSHRPIRRSTIYRLSIQSLLANSQSSIQIRSTIFLLGVRVFLWKIVEAGSASARAVS